MDGDNHQPKQQEKNEADEQHNPSITHHPGAFDCLLFPFGKIVVATTIVFRTQYARLFHQEAKEVDAGA
jgi:hypothetical protein